MERPRHLLLIDDDPHFVMLMGEFLEKRGFQVSRASDGRQGLEVAQRVTPDLIVCDIMMPRMNGYEVVQNLRQQQKSWTPVIFLSAKGEINDRIKGLQEGADAYLVKPFEPDELIALVDSLIRRTSQLQANTRPINTSTVNTTCTLDDLTPTEQRVLSLVAKGLANKLIAKEMKVSQRTVESHVSSILQKTSFSNRTEVTRWAIESGFF